MNAVLWEAELSSLQAMEQTKAINMKLEKEIERANCMTLEPAN